MNLPRIVIAGTHSGVGKTTITLGLLAALRRRGLKLQPFKVGPDYIDPGLHQVAAGCFSHNLDSWMGSPEELRQLFLRHAPGNDINVIEGVMGLFDGARGQGELGSTAQVAKILKAPVLLVISAKGLARSAAALVNGYRYFDRELNICGVIANHVGSERHSDFIRETIEQEIGLPFLGALTNRQSISMPQRHLGLLPASENNNLPDVLLQLAEVIEGQLEVAKIIELAGAAPEIDSAGMVKPAGQYQGIRLAVARDEAFNFYYQDSLDFLTELGAEIITFSPLADSSLPDNIDGIIIGGGFPEEFLPRLSANQELKQQLAGLYHQGIPIYAECGGLMYLCTSIANLSGEDYPGVGLVPARVSMGNRLAALGYVTASIIKPCLLGNPGLTLKGHEFHWSTIDAFPAEVISYRLTGGRGQAGRPEGYVKDNLLASYVHLHFRYNQQAARNYLAACAQYKMTRSGIDG